jgi:hypothetical protein
VVTDADLVRFLTRYGWAEDARMNPSYKRCIALFNSAKEENDAEFLPFRKNDEMVIGFWSEKRGWSAVLLLRDPFDYTSGRRKWGLVPNVYVQVMELLF